MSFTASSAWQIFVEKRQGRHLVAPFNDSPKALKKLIFEITEVLSSEYKEVVNAGTRALNSLTGKVFTKLMETSLDMLDNSFEGIDEETAVKRFNYFWNLVDYCDENIIRFRKRIEGVIGRMIVHPNQEVKQFSSEVFKSLKKTLQDDNFVRDFIKNNFCSYDDQDDPALLEQKMTFLKALIAEPSLNVSPVLTAICLNPKDDSEDQFFSRAKLLRLVICFHIKSNYYLARRQVPPRPQ